VGRPERPLSFVAATCTGARLALVSVSAPEVVGIERRLLRYTSRGGNVRRFNIARVLRPIWQSFRLGFLFNQAISRPGGR